MIAYFNIIVTKSNGPKIFSPTNPKKKKKKKSNANSVRFK